MKKSIASVLKQLLGLSLSSFTSYASVSIMPHDFIKLSDVDSSIVQSPRYASAENFLGRPVPGYSLTAGIYCTYPTAIALKHVNATLHKQGYALVVYDAYRPQRAVNAFIAWSKSTNDQLGKAKYYPTLPKSKLFSLGYLRKKSGHSRGSTVDLTLISLKQTLKPVKVHPRQLTNGETILFLDDNTVDMGSSFDLLHPASHHGSALVTAEQARMRRLLLHTMNVNGFQGVSEEWWHYTLINEPYTKTYFDFLPGA